MGNSPKKNPSKLNSSQDGTDSINPDKLSFINHKNHPVLGKIQLWKSKSSTSKKPQLFSLVLYNHLPPHNMSDHINLIGYKGCFQKENLHIFGSVPEFILFFDYYSITLRKIIDYSMDQQNFLQEKRIWNFIFQIVNVGAYLQERNQYHSDIRPETMFFDRSKTLKIFPYGTFTQQSTGYSKTLAYNQESLLSPELMKSLRQKKINPQSNPYKNDVYSLGMTLLEIVAQKNSRDYYDYIKGTIDYQELQKGFGIGLRNNYSRKLIDFIGWTLQYEESRRPTFQELQNRLPEQNDNLSNSRCSDLEFLDNSYISVSRSPQRIIVGIPQKVQHTQTQPDLSASYLSPKMIKTQPQQFQQNVQNNQVQWRRLQSQNLSGNNYQLRTQQQKFNLDQQNGIRNRMVSPQEQQMLQYYRNSKRNQRNGMIRSQQNLMQYGIPQRR